MAEDAQVKSLEAEEDEALALAIAAIDAEAASGSAEEAAEDALPDEETLAEATTADAQIDEAAEPLSEDITAVLQSLEAEDGDTGAASNPDPATDPDPDPATAAAPAWTGFAENVAPDTVAKVPTWPFLVYVGLCVVFAALLVWQFIRVPVGQAVYEATLYPASLLAGVVLLIAGPLLALLVWLVSSARMTRPGYALVVSLFKGSLVTFVGAALWWGALLIVDAVRLGRLF